VALQKIASARDIPDGTGKKIVVGGKTLALFNSGGKFYCVDGECPHRGAPLYEGSVEGTELECPWHGSRFDLATGHVKGGPAAGGIRSYRVRVVAGDVMADI